MTPFIEVKGGFDTVTGSRTEFTIKNKTFFVDCGLFQGPQKVKQRNWNSTGIKPDDVSGVFLTHAHLDHCGYIPRLCKLGYDKKIFCTLGTQSLAKVILLDAGYLEEETARYANEKKYSNHNPALPLFTYEEASSCLKSFVGKKPFEWNSFDDLFSYRFLRAGHIIGSSFIQFQWMKNDKSNIITFSGDIGQSKSLTMKEASIVKETDYLVLESTYGDRLHPEIDIFEKVAKIVNEVIDRNGVLIIPSFAVGRAQELVFLFRTLEEKKLIPSIPIFLDSPMAIEATQIFLKHKDDQKISTSFNSNGFLPKKFKAIKSAQESRQICHSSGPMIIVSSSGMLSGGRILHHIKARISDRRNTILFTGFQAEGTKGRWLQENKNSDTIRIFKEEIPIKAKIETIDTLSAHGDYKDILNWLGELIRPPKMILLNHGSKSAQKNLQEKIKQKFGFPVKCAFENQKITLE